MAEQNAIHKIQLIRQRYIFYRLLADALLAAAIAILAGIVLHVLFAASLLWPILVFVLAFGLLLFIHRPWQVSDSAVADFLDASYPELEESANLVLMPATDLNLLQRLQLNKVSQAIEQVPANHKYFTQRLRVSGILFLGTLILAFLLNKVHYHWANDYNNADTETSSPKTTVPEKVLPQIELVNINIDPPAYTHLPVHKQDKFTLEIPEGAAVNWKLETNIPVQRISLLFNEQENLPLKSSGNKSTWLAQKTITKPGFYQVIIDGKRSDLYQIQVIKDLPPVIQIKTPKQYTYIDAGEKPQITINATATDDYGVSDATIFATIAKGSGEAVKFKEQKISFPVSFSNQQKKYELQKTIDLPSLNMEPGDELYFYLQARDNHQQLSRTDVYIVSIQDTAQLLSMDGLIGATNIKPEYFRSERQIILDSETLLKQKDTISQASFNERSNELGTDQKLLRLRYGKFLGEEAENEIGDPNASMDKLSDPADYGNAAKILDEYTDKHDNAEDAQFFDPAVKAQLKATLTEMWKAELQLRLYKPQDALPFEYKALRLLKDLQQKSRSYVAKTAYNPSPLKMDKRLTGDLSKIIQPDDRHDIHTAEDQFDALKRSVTILEQLKATAILKGSDYRTLQLANQQLSLKASQQPAIYLGSVSAMRRILAGDKKNSSTDIAVVETAIQKILPASQMLPQNSSAAADMGLSHGYYLKLNRTNR